MNEIERARRRKGLTRYQVAVKIGVTEGTVYNWERRGVSPTGENVVLLAKLLGVEPSLFYAGM